MALPGAKIAHMILTVDLQLDFLSPEIPIVERRCSMQWLAPSFEEITLSCEINSYANADL